MMLFNLSVTVGTGYKKVKRLSNSFYILPILNNINKQMHSPKWYYSIHLNLVFMYCNYQSRIWKISCVYHSQFHQNVDFMNWRPSCRSLSLTLCMKGRLVCHNRGLTMLHSFSNPHPSRLCFFASLSSKAFPSDWTPFSLRDRLWLSPPAPTPTSLLPIPVTHGKDAKIIISTRQQLSYSSIHSGCPINYIQLKVGILQISGSWCKFENKSLLIPNFACIANTKTSCCHLCKHPLSYALQSCVSVST